MTLNDKLWVAARSVLPSPALFLFAFIIMLTGAKGEVIVDDPERYFPFDIGRQWTYTGVIADQIQHVSDYTNTAIIKGKTKKRGTPVVVLWESNQSGREMVESYLAKDATGITYFGSKPMTDFEMQLIPYPVIPFPIVLGKRFVQLEKTGVTYDLDLDHDGVKEKANILADLTAVSMETISTSAGTFQDAIKFEGKMTVWIQLSKDKRKIAVVGTTTHWFAKDVGMVKQIEKMVFPEGISDTTVETITTEILTDYSKPKSPA
ncbi:MAG: hypothetical protein AAB300_04420 [Nitrospirota bacterium]